MSPTSRLETCGLVEKAHSRRDARVTYAVLTDAGRQKIDQASRSHRAVIQAVLSERYNDHELETLVELLGRLGGVGAAAAPLALARRGLHPVR